MGRKTIVNSFLNKKVGGIIILEPKGSINGRLLVKCKCLHCEKYFEAQFHNVYRGNYKSCGCLQHALGFLNPKWKGHGEISKSYFNSLKLGAKRRNLEFKINIEEIWELFLSQKRKCALSGVQLFFPKIKDEKFYNASLDRIDSKIGYLINNLQWVDRNINFMKQSFNNEEFLSLVRKIYKYNYE